MRITLVAGAIGALIAIQRGINLTTYVETGERIDKLVSAIGEPIRRNGNTEEGT